MDDQRPGDGRVERYSADAAAVGRPGKREGVAVFNRQNRSADRSSAVENRRSRSSDCYLRKQHAPRLSLTGEFRQKLVAADLSRAQQREVRRELLNVEPRRTACAEMLDQMEHT